MPQISVIVPVYNSEKYLCACLDSLLAQSVSDIEILCIDDGSTDSSPLLLRERQKQDPRIRIFHQENSGVGAARNLALNHAAGEWIAFCDSDDTVPVWAYRDFLKNTGEADLIVGAFEDYSDDGKCLPRFFRKKIRSVFDSVYMTPCIWNKLVRRDFVTKHNLSFSNAAVGEDVIFLTDLMRHQPNLALTNTVVYRHWNHNADCCKSLNHQYTLQQFQEHLFCRYYILEAFPNCIKEAEQYVYHEMTSFLVEFLFRLQEFKEKEAAFSLFRPFILNHDWKREQGLFHCLMGIDCDLFRSMSAYDYFTTANFFDHAEKVKLLYESGMMGARYIIKYAIAWWKYKWKGYL